MEVKINKEIQSYSESMFLGLSMRQCGFSLAAILVAVGLYFLLKPYPGLCPSDSSRYNAGIRW